MMKITVPDYYLKFKCIADKCTDSCCIGWEIDIDDRARAKYAALGGDLGDEIREKTKHGVFPLEKNGRCAFLNNSGLCRIISALGDGYLCNICREHPRYYGVGVSGLDGGLGLACPEAAQIILEQDKMPEFVTVDGSPSYSEEDIYACESHKLRELIYRNIYSYDALFVRSMFPSIAGYADEVAFAAVSGLDEVSQPDITDNDEAITDNYISRLIDLFFDCESLGDEWKIRLGKARTITADALKNEIAKNSKPYQALLFYFTHRYLRECIEDMSAMARVLLATHCSDLIFLLSLTYESDSNLIKSAVLFSKNIEYSTDNIDFILDEITAYL